MMDFIISAGIFLAKGLAVGVMAIACVAIYMVEAHRAEKSAL